MRRRWQLASSWFMAHGAYKAFGGAFGSFAQDTTSQGAFSWHRHICDRRYRCLIESSGSCHEQLLPPFAHKHQHFHIHNLVASNSTEYLVNSIDCNLLRLSCTRNCHRGSQAQASPNSTADFIRQAGLADAGLAGDEEQASTTLDEILEPGAERRHFVGASQPNPVWGVDFQHRA